MHTMLLMGDDESLSSARMGSSWYVPFFRLLRSAAHVRFIRQSHVGQIHQQGTISLSIGAHCTFLPDAS